LAVFGAADHAAGEHPDLSVVYFSRPGGASAVAMIHNTIHVLLALAMPPLLPGVINKTKALFAGRVGPPLLQPYYDLIKLFRKGSVFSTTTTWMFRAGPVVGLATVVLAVLLVPLGNNAAPVSFTGDVILLAYLLGLGRV